MFTCRIAVIGAHRREAGEWVRRRFSFSSLRVLGIFITVNDFVSTKKRAPDINLCFLRLNCTQDARLLLLLQPTRCCLTHFSLSSRPGPVDRSAAAATTLLSSALSGGRGWSWAPFKLFLAVRFLMPGKWDRANGRACPRCARKVCCGLCWYCGWPRLWTRPGRPDCTRATQPSQQPLTLQSTRKGKGEASTAPLILN